MNRSLKSFLFVCAFVHGLRDFFSLHRSLVECVSGECVCWCVCVECEKNNNDEITTVNILAKTPYFFLHQNTDVSYFFLVFFRSEILLIHFAGRNSRARRKKTQFSNSH